MDQNTSKNNNSNAIIAPSTDNVSENDLGYLIEKPDSVSLLSVRKDLIFILVFVLIIFGLHLSPLRQYVAGALKFIENIKEFGILAPLIFTGGVTVLVCVGVPRLLLCPIGGMLFGVFWGLMYCVTGTIIAYYIIFLFVRGAGRNFIIRHYPKLNRFTNILERGGIPGVILARQMPVHGMVVNLILGLSPVRQRDFLVGTAIGVFPEAIPFTIIGKGVKQGSLEKSAVYIVLALVVFAVLWLGLKIWIKRKKQGQSKIENDRL